MDEFVESNECKVATEVPVGYILSFESTEQTLVFSDVVDGIDSKYYISAQHPFDKEDKIRNKTMQFAMSGKKEADIEGSHITGNVCAAAAFVEKCICQITGFKIPAKNENGNIVDIEYNPASRGDNRENKRVYTTLLASPFMQIVDGFLDTVAGRDTASSEMWNELKNAR